MTKYNPWYMMISDNKLKALVWDYPYNQETIKKIEEGLETIQNALNYYQMKVDTALDKTIVMWYNQRIDATKKMQEYYTRNYNYFKEIIK